MSGNAPEVSSLGCEALDLLHCHTALLKVCHRVSLQPCPSPASLQMTSWCWLVCLSSSVKSLYTCLYTLVYKLKIVTGLPWEHFQILIFFVLPLHAPSTSCVIMRSWSENLVFYLQLSIVVDSSNNGPLPPRN